MRQEIIDLQWSCFIVESDRAGVPGAENLGIPVQMIGNFSESEVTRMAKTLYVGNLPWTTTEEELTEAFGAYVTVESVRIIKDRETGRSKGFGFVEVTEDDLEDVIAKMNGSTMGGRTLVVNEAKPRLA